MKFSRKGKFYVYIIQCADETFYTGYTNDLTERLKLHNSGRGAKYVRGKSPVKLVWKKEYKYFKNAVNRENAIKKLTRAEKEALIKEDAI